jgi:hypothetical protein
VAQFDDLVWNSGWRPTKPDGVEDPLGFVEQGSNPQGWHDLEGLRGLQFRPNRGLPFTGPLSADGFCAIIITLGGAVPFPRVGGPCIL